jgi:hypothetical protein
VERSSTRIGFVSVVCRRFAAADAGKSRTGKSRGLPAMEFLGIFYARRTVNTGTWQEM